MMIKIRRLKDKHDFMRPYTVYLDNEKVGKVKNGKELQFEVTEGKHLLFLKVDWCTSNQLIVYAHEHENVILECYPTARDSKKIISAMSIFKKRSNYIVLKIIK